MITSKKDTLPAISQPSSLPSLYQSGTSYSEQGTHLVVLKRSREPFFEIEMVSRIYHYDCKIYAHSFRALSDLYIGNDKTIS